MSTKNRIKFAISAVLLITCTIGFSQQIKLGAIFGNLMILQREKPIPVWGIGASNEEITVTFAGQSKTTISGVDGKWMVQLDPLKASAKGRTMVIAGKTKVTLTDILVGEVWICSGQSNMEFSTSLVPEAKGLIPFYKDIRSFEVAHNVAFDEQKKVEGKWHANHPKSAVAFSFAYFLQDLADVPVGIIHTSWGSSSIEAWMPRAMTQTLPHFKTIMEEFDADTSRLKRIQEIINRQGSWTREENIYLRRQPNILYNAMMHPLIPFACRGVVWYQGERNTRYLSGMPEVDETNWFHRVCGMKDYGEVLKKWMLNYRTQWEDESLYFMTVMLPGFTKNNRIKSLINPESPTEELSWAWMRESQMQSLDLPNTSVINTIDLGDTINVHPTDKLPIGQRGALLAAKNTLGQAITAEGPTFKKVDLNEKELVIHFNHASGLQTHNGKNPTGFWIANDTKEWMVANARIEGEQVILSAPKLQSPKYVRYAFAGKPTVNLINELGLPAYPFRTDNWE